MTANIRRILAAQALRAFAYGFGAVLLGATLADSGWSSLQVGILLTAVVAGTAAMTLAVGTFAERVGRRRWYVGLFVGLAVTGAIFGLTNQFLLLVIVALSGTLSTEVVESGPFTSLEQAMLPSGLDERSTTRTFGLYNAVATLFGAAGALAAAAPALLRDVWPSGPADQRFFLLFVPIAMAGAAIAASLSRQVETDRREDRTGSPLTESRPAVMRLSALFALDAFAGGFVIQSFIAYWFTVKFGVSLEALGVMFFCVGMLQTASFLAAPRVAERIGLLNTMVFTHLPSNLLLISVAFAQHLPVAIALLFGRQLLSQMDVPTRQAYIAILVRPEERAAAAAYTNTARYIMRPLGPLLAGVALQIALGLPFVLGGSLKVVYDILIWRQFRSVPLGEPVKIASVDGSRDQ